MSQLPAASHFKYVDSSEEEEVEEKGGSSKEKTNKGFNSKETLKKVASEKKRICCLSDQLGRQLLSANEQDDVDLFQALEARRQGEFAQKLLIHIQDAELQRNIEKRDANYEYFLQRVQIDQKYQQSLTRKAQALKNKNTQKRLRTEVHRAQQICAEEQNLLRKYAVDKKEKKQAMMQHLRQQVRQMQKQKTIEEQKRLKNEMVRHRQEKRNQMESLLNQQKNELQLLRSQLEEIRDEKRANKLEGQKVLKSLADQVEVDKKGLAVRIRRKEFGV